MSTSPSVPDSQNVAPLDDVLSSPTPSPLSLDAVDPVTRLLEAAEGLALLRMRVRPVTRNGAAGMVVSDTDICDECQRQRVLSGMAHAGSCMVGQVLEACAAVRAANAETPFNRSEVRVVRLGLGEVVSNWGHRNGVPCLFLEPVLGESGEPGSEVPADREPQITLDSVSPGSVVLEIHGERGAELVIEDMLCALAAARPKPERRVVCGRAIAVFGFPGKDALTCDLEPGHGDGWHHDQTANRMWVADATKIYFHPSGMVETRLLGREPEFEYSAAANAEVAR